jgi:hypothetical protein
LAERVLGKDEVTSSILVIGSILRSRIQAKDAHRSAKREGGPDERGDRELRLAGHAKVVRRSAQRQMGNDSRLGGNVVGFEP